MNPKTFNVYAPPQQTPTWYVPVSMTPQQQQQAQQQAYAPQQAYGGSYMSAQQQVYFLQQHPSGAQIVYPLAQQYPMNYVPLYNPTPAAQQPALMQPTYGAPVHQPTVPQVYASTPSKKLSVCDPVTKTELNFSETRITPSRLRTISCDANDEKKLASENFKHSVLLNIKLSGATENIDHTTAHNDGKSIGIVKRQPRRSLVVELPPSKPSKLISPQSKLISPQPQLISPQPQLISPQPQLISPQSQPILPQMTPRKEASYAYDRDTLLFFRKLVTEHKNLFPVSMIEEMDAKDVNEPTVDKKEEKKKTNIYRPSGQHRVTPQQQHQRGVDSFPRPIVRSEPQSLKRAPAAVDSRKATNATPDGGGSSVRESPATTANDSPPVQLRKAPNAWKPLRKAMMEMDPENAKLEKLKTEVRGIMNKITPTTFEKLTEQLCEMQIHKNAKLLPEVVDIIFEKAVDEPKYCELYSKLCSELNRFEDAKTEKQNFRAAVLHKCQKHFALRADNKEKKEDEKGVLDLAKNPIADSDKKPAVADATAEKTAPAVGSVSTQSVEVESTLTKEELELKKRKSKRNFLGTIRFISHIYCTRFIGPQILDHCVVSLIMRYQKDNDEEYIEFLVQLYETIGRTYEEQRRAHIEQVRDLEAKAQAEKEKLFKPWRRQEQPAEKPLPPPPAPYDPYVHVEQIYNHLRNSVSSYSIRTKVLVLNMVDMRKNNWKPRTVDKLTPKTMEELQLEEEEEKLREEQAREEYKCRQYRNGPPRQYHNVGGSGNNFTPPPGRPISAPTYAGGQSRMVDNDKIASNKRAMAAHASMNAVSSVSVSNKPYKVLKEVTKDVGLTRNKPSFFTNNQQDTPKEMSK